MTEAGLSATVVEASVAAVTDERTCRSLRGCFVRTPYGWGICVGDDAASMHIQVALDWRLRVFSGFARSKRVHSSVRRKDILERSFCAAGECVLTSFGTGVVLGFRPADAVHIVQLWSFPGTGVNRAFLRANSLLEVLPAAAGLAVETPLGTGICRGYSLRPLAPDSGRGDGTDNSVASTAALGHLVVDLSSGARCAFPAPYSGISCPIAVALPLIDRFIQRAARLLIIHSGTLARLRDTLQGLGLGRLQARLLSSAGETMEVARKLLHHLEARDAAEVSNELRKVADPQIESLLKAGLDRLNRLASRAQGFDGVWIGRDDSLPRCVIADAMLKWHWGDESELEIWANDEVTMELEGEVFIGKLKDDKELRWTDGDVWIRVEGSLSKSLAEESSGDGSASDPTFELSDDFCSTLKDGLADLRRIIRGDVLEGEEVETALSAIRSAAASDKEVQGIIDAVKSRHQTLKELHCQVLASRTGKLMNEAQCRFMDRLAQLRVAEVAPHFQKVQNRGHRLLTRLTTDKKIKRKTVELVTAAQGMVYERVSSHGDVVSWVSFVKETIVEKLGIHRAMLVESLGANGLPGIGSVELKGLLTSSWKPNALQAQLQSSLACGLKISGVVQSGTELLDSFESSASMADIPVVQRTYCGVLKALADLNIEAPPPIVNLIEAQAAGNVEGVAAWQTAILQSLDDDKVVGKASELMQKGEKVFEHLQGLSANKTFAQVMDQIEKHDLEKELISKLQDIDVSSLVQTADLAVSDSQARERLVSQLKDTCLDFILKVLPGIRIDKVSGKDKLGAWEISNICFSDFSFRKENVRITLGSPGSFDEDLVRVDAWDIGALFKDLAVEVKQDTFPFVHAVGVADACAKRMCVSLGFRLQRGGGGRSQVSSSGVDQHAAFGVGTQPASFCTGGFEADNQPRLVVSRRKVLMEALTLTVRDSNCAMIVNTLSYLFADVLKDYACDQVSKQLDQHTDALCSGLNTLIEQSAPLLHKIGWELPTPPPPLLLSRSALFVADRDSWSIIQLEEADATALAFIDWADPGRTFAVRA